MYTIEQYLFAAKIGNTAGIRDILASGMDVNATLTAPSNEPGLSDVVPGTTALMLAAAGGHTNAVTLFLKEKNASVKARNAQGQTVFTAILTSNLQNDIGHLGEIFDLAMRKLLYKNPLLCSDAEKQKYLTDMCIDPATSPHLVYAAERGMFKVVGTLITLGMPYNLAYPGTLPTLDGEMHTYDPLHAAIAHDYIYITNMLLDGYYQRDKKIIYLKAPAAINPGSFNLATKYGSLETIDAVQRRLPKSDQEDIDWFDVIMNTVLARRFVQAQVGNKMYRIARAADHMVARDLTLRYISRDETVVAEEIFLSAVAAGAGEYFTKTMLNEYNCAIECTDIFNNTLLMRALGAVGIEAVPGLVKYKADLHGVEAHYLASNEHIFYDGEKDTFLKGSVLAYAAFKSSALLQALLRLEDEIYPRSMKQAQLAYVCDGNGTTVTQMLLASPSRHAHAIDLLREHGLHLEHTASPMLQAQASASATGSPRRFRLPSLSFSNGCMKLPENVVSSADMPLAQASEASSPNKSSFGSRMGLPGLDLFKSKSTSGALDPNNTAAILEQSVDEPLQEFATITIQEFATITISESPKKKTADKQTLSLV